MPNIKLLTFESWVTRQYFYDYAVGHREHVPLLLVDRSPCQDPFFDPYASSSEERRPLISGLCRGIKWYQEGDQFIYISRIDYKVSQELGIHINLPGPYYFGVVMLTVKKVWDSHAKAAKDFEPRRYVVAPLETSYPPNLAHAPETVAAVARESSISYDTQRMPHTPPDATDQLWQEQYSGYHHRMTTKMLRVAECQVVRINGAEAFQLDPGRAPVFTPADWGGRSMNVMGLKIEEQIADRLRSRIAFFNGET